MSLKNIPYFPVKMKISVSAIVLIVCFGVSFDLFETVSEASSENSDQCSLPADEYIRQETARFQESEEILNSQSAQFLIEFHEKIKNIVKSCDISYVKYNLFTPKNPVEAFDLKANMVSLKDSPFDNSLQTKFLIHGWYVPLPKESVQFGIKDELLKEGSYNVIVVDWTGYNNFSYAVSSIYAAVVGFDISKLIYFLQVNMGIVPESVHLIGHSLGGHVAGFTGKVIPNLGRITGLDAAGPIFQHLPNAIRLSYTDALFVDAIHTNGAEVNTEGYGTLSPYGHIDFFPNGGSQQKGCEYKQSFETASGENKTIDSGDIRRSCNHDRAPYLFKASINRCQFPSLLCDIDTDSGSQYFYEKNSIYEEMGFHAKPNPSLAINSAFYLSTSKHYPYCLGKEHQE